jgi:hypothetical protein
MVLALVGISTSRRARQLMAALRTPVGKLGAQTAVGASAFALFELVTAGKLVFDAGVYVGALFVCAEQ